MGFHSMNRENVSHRRKAGVLPAALLGAAVLLFTSGLASAAAPYVVEHRPIEGLRYLPIEGGGEVVEPILESVFPTGVFEDINYGSAGIVPPFPVRFFGVDYDEMAAGVNGIVTFGPRSQTLCGRDEPQDKPACANRDNLTPGPIPRYGMFPNTLLAVWWRNDNCAIKHQTLGEAPNREFVIEFICPRQIEAQAWFREGDSTLEVQYGPPALIGGIAQVGLMAPPADGGLTEGYAGLDCSKNGGYCTGENFPAFTSIRYVVPPDLMVTSITASGALVPGVPVTLRAQVANIGDAAADGATTRFYLSPVRNLGPEAYDLGELEGTFDVPIRASIEVEFEATLPNDLPAGTYYVLAQADPYGAVRGDVNLDNNLGVSAPLLVGVNTPLLSVEALDVGGELVAGESFSLGWRVQNSGSAGAQRIPYSIHLSADETITPIDPQIFRGELTVAAFGAVNEAVQIELPEDIAAGAYHLGFVLDPTRVLPAAFKEKEIGVSERLHLRGLALRAITTSLPVAELASSYCVNLEAKGGSGVYHWSVEEGSSLPPGLSLGELPADAREAGEPFVTRLCGKPSALGSFSFWLTIASGQETVRHQLTVDVVRDEHQLQLVTTRLPAAAYNTAYEGKLRAAGGTSPYRWELLEGRLPMGLRFSVDGTISGTPIEDGRYPLSLRLTDRAGATVEAEIVLLVTSPTHLTCGTRSLPSFELGTEFQGWLSAAGGTKPHRWETIETRRLAEEIGDLSESLGSVPPPGLSLSGSGEVTGAPTAAGQYLWTVAVSDSEAMPAEDLCIIAVDVRLDSGLTIATRSLAPALVGAEYGAQLHVAGIQNGLEWRLMTGEVLPAGLSLSASGLISGTPSLDQLDGEDRRPFPFLVEVRDQQNRSARASLSIELLAAPPTPTETTTTKPETGCTAGFGPPGTLAAAALIALAARRRRARRGDDSAVEPTRID